ncbi:MAG: hypothetical protein M5U12_00320 [Verrucomicrobia bacterium]|nr:hypothetical protein [Verrucomicrobiota bacterium]
MPTVRDLPALGPITNAPPESATNTLSQPTTDDTEPPQPPTDGAE